MHDVVAMMVKILERLLHSLNNDYAQESDKRLKSFQDRERKIKKEIEKMKEAKDVEDSLVRGITNKSTKLMEELHVKVKTESKLEEEKNQM